MNPTMQRADSAERDRFARISDEESASTGITNMGALLILTTSIVTLRCIGCSEEFRFL